MIEFIGKKNISHSRIRELLILSEATNDYTNNGPVKELLEKKIEVLLGMGPGNRLLRAISCVNTQKKVLCFSSGTGALHGIMFLCKKKYNIHKWVTPAFTFPSAVVGGAFDVSILDIDSETATLPMDADLLADFDGIILTNLFGSYVDLKSWEEFCKRHNKVLIFDNASSPLSTCENINICNFGDYSFGSLHHTKYLGFGEGGFAVVKQEDYEMLSQITNFGYDENKKYDKLSSNYKMSDVSAAYIISQIENYDKYRHIDIQVEMTEHIKAKKGMNLFNYKPGTFYGNIPVIFDREISQEDLTKKSGIEIFKYYKPLMEMPEARNLYSRIINLPIYGSMNSYDVANIIKGIKKI